MRERKRESEERGENERDREKEKERIMKKKKLMAHDKSPAGSIHPSTTGCNLTTNEPRRSSNTCPFYGRRGSRDPWKLDLQASGGNRLQKDDYG